MELPWGCRSPLAWSAVVTLEPAKTHEAAHIAPARSSVSDDRSLRLGGGPAVAASACSLVPPRATAGTGPMGGVPVASVPGHDGDQVLVTIVCLPLPFPS